MYKRLFIAIKINPTEEVLRRVYYLQENLMEENINWIKTDHYHLTLKFLGKTRTNQIESISNDIRNIASHQGSFKIELGDLGLFGSRYNPKVIWIEAEPIKVMGSLQENISNALSQYGFTRDKQNFVPHLSIARIRKLKHKEHFQKIISNCQSGLNQHQLVNEITLFESELLQRGAVYKVIDKFPLKQE